GLASLDVDRATGGSGSAERLGGGGTERAARRVEHVARRRRANFETAAALLEGDGRLGMEGIAQQAGFDGARSAGAVVHGAEAVERNVGHSPLVDLTRAPLWGSRRRRSVWR